MKELFERLVTGNEMGPYSTATIVNLGDKDMIFISGHIAPEKKDASFKEEAEAMLEKWVDTLTKLNCKPSDLVMVEVSLVPKISFTTLYASFNEVYKEFFPGEKFPARAATGTEKLPGEVRVEIRGIAVRVAQKTAP